MSSGVQIKGRTVFNNSDINNPDIDGGSADDLTVGGATPSSGVFTTTITNADRKVPIIYSPIAAAVQDLDLSAGNIHDITMPAGNVTITISNEINGQIFTIRILQDGIGSRTVTWFTTIKWAGGASPTLTTTQDKADSFIFRCTGADAYDGFIIGQNI